MKKFSVFLLMIATSIVLLIAGCWIPENFEAKVTINKDGSYMFTYDGTLTYALALASAKEGSLTQKDEAEFKKGENELRKEPGFKKVKYLGKGRYKVLVKKSGNTGERFDFISREMNFFSIIPQNNGLIKITAIRFSKKDINELKSIGAKINGTLTVSVEKGVKVIKHNAQSEPKLFGLLGGYKWELKSVDAQPFIIVQPSPYNVNILLRHCALLLLTVISVNIFGSIERNLILN